MDLKQYDNNNNIFKLDADEQLLKIATKLTYKKNDFVYQKGDAHKGLFFICSGLVGLTDITDTGNEILLRVFGKNFYFGHRSFLANESYHATTVCLTDVILYHIPFEDIDELIVKSPQLVKHLLKVLAMELRLAEEKFNDLSGKAATSRIIESLIFLKHRNENYNWTRKEIGEFCGCQTETVTRVLTLCEKAGLISKDGRKIIILDENNLLQYADKSTFK